MGTEVAPPSARTVRALAALLILMVVALVAEGGSYLVVSFLAESPQTRLLFYKSPTITQADYAQYLRRRDPRLGWPPPDQFGGDQMDASGARRNPAFPDPGGECITLYGDSFTFGSDVSDAEAWSTLLSRSMGCRIGNFGVGGYGTDQAYLRLEYNEGDRAPVTLLGIHPTDAIRNLTRYGYLALGLYPTTFKPRFARSGSTIVLLPMPDIPASRLDAFTQAPAAFLGDDVLLPGSSSGPVEAKFPYMVALVKVATRPTVRNWLQGRPSWMNLFTPGDETASLEVMQGIIGRFTALCAQRHKRCGVILFPSPNSYAYTEKTGRSAFAALRTFLANEGVMHIDLTDGFARTLRGKPFCDYVGTPGRCIGHFNASGNALIAQLMHEFLLAPTKTGASPPTRAGTPDVESARRHKPGET